MPIFSLIYLNLPSIERLQNENHSAMPFFIIKISFLLIKSNEFQQVQFWSKPLRPFIHLLFEVQSLPKVQVTTFTDDCIIQYIPFTDGCIIQYIPFTDGCIIQYIPFTDDCIIQYIPFTYGCIIQYIPLQMVASFNIYLLQMVASFNIYLLQMIASFNIYLFSNLQPLHHF